MGCPAEPSCPAQNSGFRRLGRGLSRRPKEETLWRNEGLRITRAQPHRGSRYRSRWHQDCSGNRAAYHGRAMSRMGRARTTASLSSARPARCGNASDGGSSAPPRCRRQWRPGFAPTSRRPTPNIWQRNTGPSHRRRDDRRTRRLARRERGQSRSRQRIPNVKTSCRPFVRPISCSPTRSEGGTGNACAVSWIGIWPTRSAKHKLRMRALRLLHESLVRRAPLAIAAPNAGAL